MSTQDDYDYERYEQIVTTIIQDGCAFSFDAEALEIGEDCSDIQSIKVIFDGFGLAEDYYYNGRTFAYQDGEVMVQNEDYEMVPLSEDDEDFEHVKEKLELFEEYADADGPKNPNMRSYAVFIDHRSGDPEFVFPPHDITPWALIHRPKQEVCLYVWQDVDNNTWEVLPLEDRIDSDSPFSCQDIMTVLEKSWEDNFSWKDDEDYELTFPYPTQRPEEGQSQLNKNAAWPFATAPLAKAEETTDEEEVEEERVYAPGELIRIEEMNGKKYEVRQPSADFSSSFPGVLEMIEIKDPSEPKQDYRAILENVIAKHGLPTQMGAKGWISETQNFYYEDKPIATAEDGLKGWLYVEQDDDGDGEPSWSNVDELIEVARAMIEDNNDDETSLNVNVIGAKEDEWDIRSVKINNDEADGKSWDYEIDMDEDEFWEIVKKVMIENGEIDEPEDEDEEIDNDDIDVNTFLWSYCTDMGGEQRFSYGYGVAYMEFSDGFKVGMTMRDGDLYIHYYDGKDVTKDTVFE